MSGDGVLSGEAASLRKPVPHTSPEAAPYWQAAARHRLELPRCDRCGQFWFPPSCLCPHCLSDTFHWQQVSGRGRVHSFVVVHRVYDPAFAHDVPYVVAVIALEEGPRMLSNIVDVAPDEVRCGMPVAVRFDDLSADLAVPKFAPAAAGTQA
ncbi:MAG: Zn-ribbon domain-containing OB-fold protein [Xanthobacteraceae bacterium]|jgi:uncharacterized OB-fold protein